MMDKFKERLLNNKIISVWGIGYLGYTKILKLQAYGFKVNAFDNTNTGFKEKIKHNNYLTNELVFRWSEHAYIPPIDITKINIGEIDLMFNTNIHILAFPFVDREGNRLLNNLVNIFIEQKDKLKDALIIFQSVSTPGVINRDFIDKLHKNGINIDVVTAFRNDWTLEEFFFNSRKRMLAANNLKALKKGKCFYNLLGANFKILSSIKESEIYENARNSFQYLTTAFINQLAFAYPDTNIRNMTEHLLDDIELDKSHLSIGTSGYKMVKSIENLLEGSNNPNAFSLAKEAGLVNLGLILEYAEVVKRKGFQSVTLLGLTIKGNQKNIDLSPSVILSEHLIKSGIYVCIDDPFYNETSLSKIVKNAKHINIFKDGLKCDALFVMTDHKKYRSISQNDINTLGFKEIKIIIDNVSLFKEFTFDHPTIYHSIGDGNLGKF